MSTKEIVVGLNGSAAAAKALHWAVDESLLRGAPLRIVHTWELVTGEAMVAARELRESSAAQAREQATRWVTSVLVTDELPGELDIVEGPPGPVLVARSQHAAMLVVGTQEHHGVRRLLAGSISHYCLSHATCPVVAIPGPAKPQRHFPHPRHREVSSPGPIL